MSDDGRAYLLALDPAGDGRPIAGGHPTMPPADQPAEAHPLTGPPDVPIADLLDGAGTIPAAVVREHGARVVDTLIEQANTRLDWSGLTVASAITAPARTAPAPTSAERHAAVWAGRDRIRARRRSRRGRKQGNHTR